MKCRACIKVVASHEVNGLHKGIYIACSSESWFKLAVRLINSLSSALLGD
jgi:hypothetical protein